MIWKIDATINPLDLGKKVQAILMMNPDVKFVIVRNENEIRIHKADSI